MYNTTLKIGGRKISMNITGAERLDECLTPALADAFEAAIQGLVLAHIPPTAKPAPVKTETREEAAEKVMQLADSVIKLYRASEPAKLEQ